MHISIATSLSTMLVTGPFSAYKHHQRGSLDITLVKSWTVLIIVGSISGVVIVNQLDGSWLRGLFAGLLIVIASKMLLPHIFARFRSPMTMPASMTPYLIGMVSAMLGVGGGTMTVPTLVAKGFSMHRAIGTSSMVGFVICVPAVMAYVMSGWQQQALSSGYLGYVNLYAFIFITIGSVIAVPIGVKIAYGLQNHQLKLIFGVVLLLIALRMLVS